MGGGTRLKRTRASLRGGENERKSATQLREGEEGLRWEGGVERGTKLTESHLKGNCSVGSVGTRESKGQWMNERDETDAVKDARRGDLRPRASARWMWAKAGGLLMIASGKWASDGSKSAR